MNYMDMDDVTSGTASYARLSTFLGTRATRKLCHETRVLRMDSAGIAVRHYATNILVFWPDGAIDVDARIVSGATRRRLSKLADVAIYPGSAQERVAMIGMRAWHVPCRFRIAPDGRPVGGTPVIHARFGEVSSYARLHAMLTVLALAPYAERAGVPSLGLAGKPRSCCRRPTCQHRRVAATWYVRNVEALAVVAVAHGVRLDTALRQHLER